MSRVRSSGSAAFVSACSPASGCWSACSWRPAWSRARRCSRCPRSSATRFRRCARTGSRRRACQASVSQELAAAARYLQSRDSASQADFRTFATEAHRVQREMYLNKGQAEDELSLIASVEAVLSAIETQYAMAHRLADLGRREESDRAADVARTMVDTLTKDLDQLAMLKSRVVTEASRALRVDVERRAMWMLVAIAVSVVLGLMVVFSTVNWISDADAPPGHARARAQQRELRRSHRGRNAWRVPRARRGDERNGGLARARSSRSRTRRPTTWPARRATSPT